MSSSGLLSQWSCKLMALIVVSVLCGDDRNPFGIAIEGHRPLLFAQEAGAGAEPASNTNDSDNRSLNKLAREYVQKFEEFHRLTAANRFLEQEISILESPVRFPTETPLTAGISSLRPDAQGAALAVLDANYAAYFKGLQDATKAVEADVEQSRQRWIKTRLSLAHSQQQMFNAGAQSNFASQAAQIINAGNRWLWFSAMVAGIVLAGVHWYFRRQYYRRLFWVRKAGLARKCLLWGSIILVPGIPTVITFVFGNEAYESWVEKTSGLGQSPTKTIEADLKKLQASFESSQVVEKNAELRGKWEETQSKWRAQVAPTNSTPDIHALVKKWEEARKQIQECQVHLGLQKELAKILSADLKQLEDVESKLETLRTNIHQATERKEAVAAGLGCILLTVYGSLAWSFTRRLNREIKRRIHTCPRCLGVGKLELLADVGGARMGLPELFCRNVISTDPYEECGFQFNQAYADRVKLGFPVLGVSSSGKTHGLAMVYRELNRGRYPENVHFEKIKGAAANDFDRMVEMILGARIGTAATNAARMPHPLIFNFRDNDRLGATDLMVSIFDYAGTVIMDDFHHHRSRALNAEGYFFFLDPTQPDEQQVRALVSFREDLRLATGLKSGQQLHVPVAICITKIDLMVNQMYAQGSDLIDEFYRDLGEIDKHHPGITLDAIERRSELIGRLREVIWPGWNVERQIRDLFGDRYLLFPLTPVGLDQPGVSDLSVRNIEPYAILEPLLWLLHMNGYPVLEHESKAAKSV